ncbi:MAG: lipoprotein-releasing ABC transporter permease subunit [Rickettsiaceae bacterium H1]|nr:lipoprotein-releasing ABC transporter permease subunit [Rickettsiaceae bacterium H1]
MWFEFLIALHYLRPKGAAGVTALFSLIGITLGVATLTVTTAVMNGFRAELINGITNINGHITIYGKIDQNIIKNLQNNQKIKKIIPTISNQAMISSKHSNSGVLIRGVEAHHLQNIEKKIISGKFSDFHNGILIGKKLSDNLAVKIGDKVDLLSTQHVVTMMGNIPKMKTFTIAGIFEFGMFEYDNIIVYMPIDIAKEFFHYNNINSVDIHMENPEEAELLAQKIEDEFNISTTSWKERGGYLEALEIEKTVMFLILTMIILVASFNIISSLIMLVQNKKAAIAILRTIGATRSSIMRIFFICGGSIGLIGTISGLILGVVFINNIEEIKILLESLSGIQLFNPLIYFFNKIPSLIMITDIIKISSMSLTLSLLAAVLPSIQATKQEPAKILRRE